MTQGKQILSQIVPVLAAALVCDVACTDPSTGKHTLIGIFHTLHVMRFPTQRPYSLYLKVSGAEGYYEMDVRFVHVASSKILAKAEGKMQSNSRVVAMDLYIPFPPLKIPSEGQYEFQVWANSVYLGSTCIDALKQNLPREG